MKIGARFIRKKCINIIYNNIMYINIYLSSSRTGKTGSNYCHPRLIIENERFAVLLCFCSGHNLITIFFRIRRNKKCARTSISTWNYDNLPAEIKNSPLIIVCGRLKPKCARMCSKYQYALVQLWCLLRSHLGVIGFG